MVSLQVLLFSFCLQNLAHVFFFLPHIFTGNSTHVLCLLQIYFENTVHVFVSSFPITVYLPICLFFSTFLGRSFLVASFFFLISISSHLVRLTGASSFLSIVSFNETYSCWPGAAPLSLPLKPTPEFHLESRAYFLRLLPEGPLGVVTCSSTHLPEPVLMVSLSLYCYMKPFFVSFPSF